MEGTEPVKRAKSVRKVTAMETAKPWWQSITVLGAIVTLGALLAQSVGHVTVSDADMKVALDMLTRESEIIGTVMALIGRIKATRPIG